MKNVIARLTVVGFALAGIGLYAQGKDVIAKVPFAFYMGDKVMPQGTYRFSEIANRGIVTVRSAAAANSLATVAIMGDKQEQAPRLVFTCYNGTCFLSQVWAGYSSQGVALPHSKRERAMASNGLTGTLAVIKLAVH